MIKLKGFVTMKLDKNINIKYLIHSEPMLYSLQYIYNTYDRNRKIKRIYTDI